MCACTWPCSLRVFQPNPSSHMHRFFLCYPPVLLLHPCLLSVCVRVCVSVGVCVCVCVCDYALACSSGVTQPLLILTEGCLCGWHGDSRSAAQRLLPWQPGTLSRGAEDQRCFTSPSCPPSCVVCVCVCWCVCVCRLLSFKYICVLPTQRLSSLLGCHLQCIHVGKFVCVSLCFI